MSQSLQQQNSDLAEQLITLIGSTIRLLHGTAGLFVFSQELPSIPKNLSTIIFQIPAKSARQLIALSKESFQPGINHPLVYRKLTEEMIVRFSVPTSLTCFFGSLLITDAQGVLGTLHFLYPGFPRAFTQFPLEALITQIAVSLRFALRNAALQEEQNLIAEEQRSTFISVISHELQTPIAIIKGYASTLARPDAHFDQQTIRARLEAIEEEADRLNKLVGNLLYASRIQAGGLLLEIIPLELGSLIQSVIRRMQARSPSASFQLNLPPYLPLVMADRERIEEVLQNLLDNAVKYSPRQAFVTITCTSSGEEVITSVSDLGMGISARDQERLFSRFRRLGNTRNQTIPGAGLGLYICRSIVEAQGGRIWVESTLHHGSTFFFSLPREEKAQLPMVVF